VDNYICILVKLCIFSISSAAHRVQVVDNDYNFDVHLSVCNTERLTDDHSDYLFWVSHTPRMIKISFVYFGKQ